eukprot:3804149-Amphidinium_carterae.3
MDSAAAIFKGTVKGYDCGRCKQTCHYFIWINDTIHKILSFYSKPKVTSVSKSRAYHLRGVQSPEYCCCPKSIYDSHS